MPGRGVDKNGIGSRLDDAFGPFEIVFPDPDRGSDAEAAVLIFGGVEEHVALFDILRGDETGKAAILVDEGQLLDAIVMQDTAGLVKAGLDRCGDEALARSHRGGDRSRLIFDEPDVATRDHADEDAGLIDDRESVDPFFPHNFLEPGEGNVSTGCERINDHCIFRALHLRDHVGLIANGHVAMDHAKTSLAGQSDGEPVFGHRVHRRRDDGNVERNIGGETRGDVNPGRQDRTALRN